jgi:hypothetical protein
VFYIILEGTDEAVYPTWCVLQALIYYILCFFSKKRLFPVCKSLKNLWINHPDPRGWRDFQKLTANNKPVTLFLRKKEVALF